MSVFGTKCGLDGPLLYKPDTLGQLYAEVANEYGAVQVNKPRVGDTYRKMHKALNQMDSVAFKRLPADIVVLSPPRLFRSTAWKYHGRFYKDCECSWEFEYETAPYIQNHQRGWMGVKILSLAYQSSTLTFKSPVVYRQLELF